MSENTITAANNEGGAVNEHNNSSKEQNSRSEYRSEHHSEHHHSSRHHSSGHHSSRHHSHKYSSSSLGFIMSKQNLLNRFSPGKKHYSSSSHKSPLRSYMVMSRRFISALVVFILILAAFLYMVSNNERSAILHDVAKTPSEVDILKKENAELRNQIKELNKTIEEYKQKCGENN